MENLRPDRRDRTDVDRRNSLDRRQAYDVIATDILGQERRRPAFDRRKNGEQRKGWVRTNKWSSIFVSAYFV
ncbi:MAG: hypothetical protein KKC46_18990 [Proteobacteria bacterium]|nr:hypothetical protein [Pseudomonadota bacterium]